MGLTKDVLAGVMRMGYKVPTPIQRSTLPLVLAGKDVVAMARTGEPPLPFIFWHVPLTLATWLVGSGKTAAFLLPMFEVLKGHSTRVGARGLILTPTRELALQTLKFCTAMSKFMDLRTTLLVGGESLEGQVSHGSRCHHRGRALTLYPAPCAVLPCNSLLPWLTTLTSSSPRLVV